jgi:hypothetical protein
MESLALLQSVFDTLFAAVEPARQERMLRGAIVMLVDDRRAAPLRGVVPRNMELPEALPAWAEIQPRLRAYLAGGPAARVELSEALGITETHLSRSLRSSGVPFGPKVLAKAVAFLEERQGAEERSLTMLGPDDVESEEHEVEPGIVSETAAAVEDGVDHAPGSVTDPDRAARFSSTETRMAKVT